MTSASNLVYGAVHSMMTLAGAQRDQGDEVQFVTFKGKPFNDELKDLGWKHTPFRVRFKVDPVAVVQMAKFFRREKIDIVHTHLSTSSVNGCLAARLAKIPCVATVHGMSGKLSFVFANHMIGVSHGVRQILAIAAAVYRPTPGIVSHSSRLLGKPVTAICLAAWSNIRHRR